jgi:hypothetical protein
MTEHFWIVGLIGVVLLLIAAQMTITSKVHYVVKMAFAALAVIGALTGWTITSGLLGYPVAGTPKNDEMILSFVFNTQAKRIYIWVLENGEPRAYFMPLDDNLAKKLTDAQEQAEKSGGHMKWHDGGSGNGPPGKSGDPNGSTSSGGDGSIPSDHTGIQIEVVPALPNKE